MFSAVSSAALARRRLGLRSRSIRPTRPRPRSPAKDHIKFAAIGLDHAHIYGMTARRAARRRRAGVVPLRGSGADRRLPQAVRRREARRAKTKSSTTKSIQLVAGRADPRPARAARRPRHEGRQGLSRRQARHHLARATRRRAQGREGNEAQVRDHVFRASRSALGRVRGRAHQAGRDRQRRADGEPRAAPRERAAAGPSGSSTRRATAASSRTSARTRPTSSSIYTNSTKAKVVAAQTGNVAYPQYPKFEDFGDMVVTGNGGTGYIRVDWYTPDGLPTWGDGRLFVLGTEGYIELRKYVNVATDIEGRQPPVHRRQEAGALHRLQQGALPFGPQFVRRHREPHGDRAGPGAGIARRRAGAQGAEESRRGRSLA